MKLLTLEQLLKKRDYKQTLQLSTKVSQENNTLKWIETKLQLVDALTKQGAVAARLLETLSSVAC